MEEKINNQKIFSYVPSLVARLILNSSLQDKDIFADGSNKTEDRKNTMIKGKQIKGKATFLTSLFINPSIYPITNDLPNTIVMNIRLKGFQRLITTLSLKDPKDQMEKITSEYLSIITPKLLSEISEIISKNGGQIIKYNDYEFTTIWNFTPKKNKIKRYEKFYAKLALLSACQIMKEVDNKEIVKGNRMKISIGIAAGKTMIGFFGGERKRGEYVVMGEAIHKAEICLNYCISNEVIIGEEINNLFIDSEEIVTKEIENNEELNLYLIKKFNDDMLKNFIGFKIKTKSDKLNMTKSVYENLAKKVYIFSSILPQGLVKYLDVGQDQNLKEINVVTIATIHVLINKEISKNFKKMQNIILDIQKATYLTFGSLLYISKTYNGLLIRCVWGMDPGSFLDDTARCISTAKLIGALTEYYNIKIGIGIATGSCYTGLIAIQGDRKQFTLMGKKVNLSRTLADEAFQKVLKNHQKKRYLIYCDKNTMKLSQKWYRHIYISKINIYLNKKSQELYYESKDNIHINYEKVPKTLINSMKNIKNDDNKMTRSNRWLLGDYNTNTTELFDNILDNPLEEIITITIEIYAPVETEEYFIQNINDPFPLLRTYKHNSYTPKIKHYFYNHFDNKSIDNQININLIGNLPMPRSISKEEEEKMNMKLEKSIKIFGYDKEVERFTKLLNIVVQKTKKQIFRIKGPLGVGKSLFLRKVLKNFLDSNEVFKKIYFNETEFIIFNSVEPLTNTFPYNTFCFILRKIFFYIKKINKLSLLRDATEELNLDEDNIKYINFILSMGKKDVNIKDKDEQEFRSSLSCFNKRSQKNIIISSVNDEMENMSYISELEGPFKIKDSNKIDNFFFEMIKIYKNHINEKHNPRNIKLRSSLTKTKIKVPLILVIDDIQMSDKYSIDFFKYLYYNEERRNNPFIIILLEQTPFNVNYRPISHRELEYFLSAISDFDYMSDNIGSDKIITFSLNPIMEKEIIKEIIVENFNNSVPINYPSNTKIENIDDKILDFLLSKTFQGIPLLIIELFDSLFQTKKFLTMNDNKFEITQELIDDNETFDWSNLLIPYIYEKIASMAINNLLNFKEILLLKYGCTIGTFFDIQTLDKINPLNLIIKKEDLNNIMEKLNNEYIIEFFEIEGINRKTRKSIICKICFPFMRETLHKKFPIERRASLHAETAKILSAGKKGYFFNSEIEGKILTRHLIYSEINVVQEIESRNYPDNIINLYKNTKIMNTNNLTVLYVKDICSRIFDRKHKNVIEGNLEMKLGNKWILVKYYVDKQWKIYFKNIKNNPNEKDLEYIIPIKDIFKNEILENNILEITIVEYSFYLLNEYKMNLTFHSDNWKDILHLNTALSFLKMIAIYEKYIYRFGHTRFPLYKPDWYAKKEKKYYATFESYEQEQIVYLNGCMPYRNKRYFSCIGLMNPTDKLISQSKDMNLPFYAIMHTAFTVLLANIQINMTKFKANIIQEENDGRLIHLKTCIPTPAHIKKPIDIYLEEVQKKQKLNEERLTIRKRSKAKYSVFPLSLMKQGKRMFGSGIFAERNERRNLSISGKASVNSFEDDENEMNEIREEGKEKKKRGKSKTIVDGFDVIKEIEDKEKSRDEKTNDNNEISDSDSSYSGSSSSDNCSKDSSYVSSSSDNIEERRDKIINDINDTKILLHKANSTIIKYNGISDNNNNNNKTEVQNKSEINNINNNNEIQYVNNDINYLDENVENYKPKRKSTNYEYNQIKVKYQKRKINAYNYYKIDRTIKSNKNTNNKNNKNISNNNTNNNNNNTNNNNNNNINKDKNKNVNNNFNIHNYYQNNININVYDNNIINSTIERRHHSFLNSDILNNINNININSLRMSFQKKGKPKQTIYIKKSNSARVRTLKEKYRNSMNYNNINLTSNNNSTNKMSMDDEEESSITSDDKGSENIAFLMSPSEKKNSKVAQEINLTREEIFSKAMISFFIDEKNVVNTEKKKAYKRNSTMYSSQDIRKQLSMNSNKNSKNNNSNNKNTDEKNTEANKTIKPKRSSLVPRLYFQNQNRNRHVTFKPRKMEKVTMFKNYSAFGTEMQMHENNINNNRIRFGGNKY